MHKPHYFIAVAFTKEEKLQLTAKVDETSIRGAFKRWVHPSDIHLTLVFIGSAEREKLEKVMDQVEVMLLGQEKFVMTITGFSYFGRKENPRVFFALPQSEEKLHNIQRVVASSCRNEGIAFDEKPFKPHLTLARKYIAKEKLTDNQLAALNELFQPPMPLEVKKICLYETQQDQTPKYKEVKSIYLT
ncbi:MAG: RNA 2',3'-cyclic phosphodiesterase [Bacillus sp. (in: firmicutes)]